MHQLVLKRIMDLTGRVPPLRAQDLLTLATVVFAADTQIPRRMADDRWTRDITLYVPVVERSVWDDLTQLLIQMLNFLTGDSWNIEFRERPLVETAAIRAPAEPLAVQDVALFSGGLDSLVGAIDLLEAGRSVALTGHYGAGVTNSVQQAVLSALQARYGSRVVPFMFHVQPRKVKQSEGEQSMRSRSMLFLSLGTMVATSFEPVRRLIVSENGFISLNVPLTGPRLGSCSTRTTHPYFMALFREVLQALSLGVSIELPARFLTKGEMLRGARNQELLRAVAPLSMSCSHPEQGRWRKIKPGNHCGYCVPCIVRRASMTAASLSDAAYDNDVLRPDVKLSVDRRKDLRAFEIAVQRSRRASLSDAVFDVLSTGPLPPGEVGDYASVYMRGMAEIARFLSARQ
ncbi:Qat anti-phage system QueC-like protein QatC [Polyangium jinanense]|uniref:Qat anti-phage system QueC-like protein QatC n=1 Tax=Polyangium jinanense TaxID=2829994 RepID=UPI00233FC93D|nr:Qat anti-phage system QueC-like protein QatC [Polyangium jinanense]